MLDQILMLFDYHPLTAMALGLPSVIAITIAILEAFEMAAKARRK